MSRRREGKGARKKGERQRWGRHVQRGLLVLGGGLTLALVVFLFVIAGRGGEEAEPFEGSVAEKGPGTPEPGSHVSGPSLYFPVREIDFGHVPLNTPASYSFEFVNAGDAPLAIEGTDVLMLEGCWPFQPVVGATTLEPGDESSIYIETMMHEGMDGPHLFEMTVRSNDASDPAQKLYVRAHFGP